jgi:hypothetical protein
MGLSFRGYLLFEGESCASLCRNASRAKRAVPHSTMQTNWRDPLMLAQLKGKFDNLIASEKKLKKLAVSLHYYLFRHHLWKRVLPLDTKNKFTKIYQYNL